MSVWKQCGISIVAALDSAVAQASPWSCLLAAPTCSLLVWETPLVPLALTLLWASQKQELFSPGSGASLCCKAAVPPRGTFQNWEVCWNTGQHSHFHTPAVLPGLCYPVELPETWIPCCASSACHAALGSLFMSKCLSQEALVAIWCQLVRTGDSLVSLGA